MWSAFLSLPRICHLSISTCANITYPSGSSLNDTFWLESFSVPQLEPILLSFEYPQQYDLYLPVLMCICASLWLTSFPKVILRKTGPCPVSTIYSTWHIIMHTVGHQLCFLSELRHINHHWIFTAVKIEMQTHLLCWVRSLENYKIALFLIYVINRNGFLRKTTLNTNS